MLASHGLSELSTVAELLATESLTNAHPHTSREYALRVFQVEGRLKVGVWDRDRRVPVGLKEDVPVADDAVRGRGLRMVRACSEGWGLSAMVEQGIHLGGKPVWVDCGAVERSFR